MDAELNARAAAAIAELGRGTGPAEAYELGVSLLPLCLEEPRLAPLAEALTRPQPPARPAAGDCAALLEQEPWEHAFTLVCGRLLALGPWPSAPSGSPTPSSPSGRRRPRSHRRSSGLSSRTAELEGSAPQELLERLESLAPGNPRIDRLRQARAPAPAPPARPLVFADELCADPGLLDLYLERFAGEPDAALAIFAPGWTPAQVSERIGPIVTAAGPAAASARLTALAVEATPENDAAAAAAATAVLGAREATGPFASLPRIAPATASRAARAPVPAGRDYLALCVIFKNEARYLREWVEFHRLVGVDHFYLYENGSDDGYAAVLEPYVREGIVTLTPWPVAPGQNAAYTHCTTAYADRAEWIGFVDADEFFFAPGGDLHAALAEFELPDVGGVAVNYVNFGTSGHRETPDGLVLESYLRRAGHETALDLPAGLRAPGLDPTDLRNYYPLNARISSVVRPARTVRFDIPHYPVYRPGFHAVTENHERIDGAIAQQTSVRKLRMNHYWTKSEEECRQKFERGRSDQAGTRRWPDDFLHRERALNEVVDTEILAWLEPLRAVLGVDGPPVDELAAGAASRWDGFGARAVA